MKYNVEDLRNTIATNEAWEKETKKGLFQETVSLLINEGKVGVRHGQEELVLSVKPKGYLVSNIVAVKLGMSRGFKTILYRTAKEDYDIPMENYTSSQREIRPNGMALSAYVDLYEAVAKTLEEKKVNKYWIYTYADTFGDSIEAQNNLEIIWLTKDEYEDVKADNVDIFDNLEEAIKFAKGEC